MLIISPNVKIVVVSSKSGIVRGNALLANPSPIIIHPSAIIAGWFDSTLSSFQGNEKLGWHLMLRTRHEEAPIGQPIGQRPERVELLTGEERRLPGTASWSGCSQRGTRRTHQQR